MKSRKHITVDFLPFILLFNSLFFCLINWNNIVDLSVIYFAICKLIKPCLIKTLPTSRIPSCFYGVVTCR